MYIDVGDMMADLETSGQPFQMPASFEELQTAYTNMAQPVAPKGGLMAPMSVGIPPVTPQPMPVPTQPDFTPPQSFMTMPQQQPEYTPDLGEQIKPPAMPTQPAPTMQPSVPQPTTTAAAGPLMNPDLRTV